MYWSCDSETLLIENLGYSSYFFCLLEIYELKKIPKKECRIWSWLKPPCILQIWFNYLYNYFIQNLHVHWALSHKLYFFNLSQTFLHLVVIFEFISVVRQSSSWGSFQAVASILALCWIDYNCAVYEAEKVFSI